MLLFFFTFMKIFQKDGFKQNLVRLYHCGGFGGKYKIFVFG